MLDLIFGWNLIPVTIGMLALYKMWFPKRNQTQNQVKVKSYTRKKPIKSEREINHEKFKKKRMAGLKGNNVVKYARLKRIESLKKRMNDYAEKSDSYFREGEIKKAEYWGRQVAKLDNEINMVKL